MPFSGRQAMGAEGTEARPQTSTDAHVMRAVSTHSWAHVCQAGGPRMSPSMGSGVVLVTRTWTLGRGMGVHRAAQLATRICQPMSPDRKENTLRNRCSVCGEVSASPGGPPKLSHPSVWKDSALTQHPEARTGTPAVRPTPEPLRSSVRQGSAPHACWETPALLSGAETGVHGGTGRQLRTQPSPLSLHVRPCRPREPGTGCSWHRPHTALGDRGQVGGSSCWVGSPWP